MWAKHTSVRRPVFERCGARPLLSIAAIGLVALILVMIIGALSRPAPRHRDPMFLGRGVAAKTMNEYAASIGCPGLLFRDGHDTVEEAPRPDPPLRG
jgi:hypothetical protein